MVRSSDQRYYHVQRTRREVEDFTVEIVRALRDARTEGKLDELDDVIERSACEYTSILLACGRTANDFRQSFRRGAAGFHVVTAAQVVPRELLLEERLDGYSLLRLSREQTRIVKAKSEKLYARDKLFHDPQGAVWAKIMRAMLSGLSEDHLDLLDDIRSDGLVLGNDRAGYEIVPFPVADQLPDNLPSNDAVLPFAARQFIFYVDKRSGPYERWRRHMTTPVRMLTAYLDGTSMMAARYCRGDEPGLHEHRSHFQARVDRITDELGHRLDDLAARWDGKRPEQR